MLTLSNANLAAILYRVALPFISGKTIPIKKTNECSCTLTGQNADVSQTTVDATYVNYMELVKPRLCFIRSPQAQLRMPEKLNICMPLFGESQKQSVSRYMSGPHQTMNFMTYVFVDLRKCASSQSIKPFSNFCFETTRFNPCTLTFIKSPCATLLHTCDLQNVPVANVFLP